MESTIIHNLSPDELREILSETSGYNPDRFYNVIVDQNWFCKIHGITRVTLHNWIKNGWVVPDETGSSTPKFRLSYVLKFDADAIKRRKNKDFILNTLQHEKRKNRSRAV